MPPQHYPNFPSRPALGLHETQEPGTMVTAARLALDLRGKKSASIIETTRFARPASRKIR